MTRRGLFTSRIHQRRKGLVPRLLLSSLLVLLAACGPRREQAGASESPPQVVLHGVELQSFEGDQLVLSGRAERLTYQRSEGAVTATNTLLRLPGRQGLQRAPSGPRGGMEIRAPQMEGSLASRQLTGSGGVVIRTADGAVARTPRATYDAPVQHARGREGVAVQGPDYALRADSFDVSLADGTFTFEGSTQTVVGGAK
jgi:lipopolysaccharide export system protein LptC